MGRLFGIERSADPRIERSADPRAEIEIGGIDPAAREHRHAAGEDHFARTDRHQDFRRAAGRRIAEYDDGGSGNACGPGLWSFAHAHVVAGGGENAKRKGKRRLSGYFTLSIAGKIAFTSKVRRIAALHGVWHGGCISMGIMFGLQRNAPPSIRTNKRPARFSTRRALPVLGGYGARDAVSQNHQDALATCFSSSICWSSPASNISIMMSLPPTNSPFT